MVLLLTAVLLIAGAAVLSSQVVRPRIGEAIAKRLQAPTPAEPAAGAPAPTVLPTVPPGTSQLVLTQDELNAQIAQHASDLKPLDRAEIQITPDGLEVDMSAYGLSGQYRGQVRAQDGKVVVDNGRIDGPLGWVVPTDPLESALNRQIASALARSNVAVQGVTLQQGQMTVALAPA